jgi:hypothetical protein
MPALAIRMSIFPNSAMPSVTASSSCDIDDDHIGALAGAGDGVGATLAARSAGDEGNFAVEHSHGACLLLPAIRSCAWRGPAHRTGPLRARW